jgi:hypothetical protein
VVITYVDARAADPLFAAPEGAVELFVAKPREPRADATEALNVSVPRVPEIVGLATAVPPKNAIFATPAASSRVIL